MIYRTLPLTAVLLAASAALSGAAQAAPHRTKAKHKPKTYVYDVTYSGRGTLDFAEDGHVEQPADYNVGTTTADIRWRGSVDDVVLRGNDVLRAGTPHSVVRVSLRSQTTRYRLDEAAPSTRACTADAGQAITAGARAIDNPDDLLTPLGGSIRLAVRPFEHATVDMNCTEDGQQSVAAWYVPEVGDAPLGEGLWDADFTLPREAIGQGKIIQLVRSTAKQGAAGGCENVGTGSTVTTCRLSWRETVTFRRHKAAKKRPR